VLLWFAFTTVQKEMRRWRGKVVRPPEAGVLE